MNEPLGKPQPGDIGAIVGGSAIKLVDTIRRTPAAPARISPTGLGPGDGPAGMKP
jgi:hypothetical protein